MSKMTDYHANMVNKFYHTFVEAQKTGNFTALEQLKSFKDVKVGNDSMNYKKMNETFLY